MKRPYVRWAYKVPSTATGEPRYLPLFVRNDKYPCVGQAKAVCKLRVNGEHEAGNDIPYEGCQCGHYATRNPWVAFRYYQPDRVLLEVHPYGKVIHTANGTVRSEYQQVLGELDVDGYVVSVLHPRFKGWCWNCLRTMAGLLCYRIRSPRTDYYKRAVQLALEEGCRHRGSDRVFSIFSQRGRQNDLVIRAWEEGLRRKGYTVWNKEESSGSPVTSP